ncbi:MAG: ribonuclease D [Alphaproteobacteria bacterium]
MNLITTTGALASFCKSLAESPYIAVDTEFMRERTYWPRLCLVQVAGPDLDDPAQAAAIDPMADGIDLAPLLELLNNPGIIKVFHAARQDVEIFYNLTQRVPEPLFDTQIAAMVCGFGDSASYETLCAKLAGAQIDKSSRFTDWSLRPLTEKQVVYALGDVTHLRVVYKKLLEQIAATGRETWLADEMASLADPGLYHVTPENAWQRLRLRHEKPQTMALVKALAAWRERVAQNADVPRGRVLKDESLMEIAHHPPHDMAGLSRIRGLGRGFAEGKHGQEILTAVAEAKKVTVHEAAPPRKHLPNDIGPVVDLLKVLLKQVSEEHGVASRLLANVEELELIASHDAPDVPAMHGWRYEMFGKLAMALKRGELAMKIEGRKVRVVETK